ncbi:MAG: hypothetical protein GF390_01900 [Candidatus Pacebacteria bacterium]|nr:hypothetical protein [Candidatus Paceibacterota bacterium]
MKKLLKSLLVLAVVATTSVTSTQAYFTSEVTVEDNEIVVGTLLLALDAAQEDSYVGTWGHPNAYNLVRENEDGSVTQTYTLEAWTNAAPGETNTYTVGIRNRGTLDMNVRAAATGAWVDGPRFGTGGCPSTADADPTLVSVSNVHQYAVTAGGGCESDNGCNNLRDGLASVGAWTPVSGLTAADSGSVVGWYHGDTDGGGDGDALYTLAESEYAVYQVEVTLSPATDNCYQGATYHFDLTAQGKQPAGAW